MYTQPTIEEIKDRIIQDIEARINQTVRLLPKSFIKVLAAVLAAVVIQLYKYIGFMFLQIFISTASFKETTILGETLTPLIEWGRLLGLGDPVQAVQTVLTIEVTVENAGTLPSGTQFISTINNVIYITTSSYSITTPTHQIQVTATTAGTIGNIEVGDIMQTVNPLTLIARDADIISIDTTGIDAESEAAYRARVLGIKQSPPQGGAFSDYRIWSNEVAGVVQSYPYSGNPGQVLVYVEGDAAIYPPDGIPDSAKLLEVAASIDRADRRPVTVIIDPAGDSSYTNIRAITRKSFDVIVSGLSVTNQADVEDEIETALLSYFLERSPYIDGLDVPPRKDRITNANVIGIVDDIVTARNGSFTGASVSTGGAPITEYFLAMGETAKLGTLTFL